MPDEKPLSKVVARLDYEQKFNLGNYQSETIKISLEGPFEDIRDGKDLPRLLLFTTTNMKKLTQKVHEGVDPRKYEDGSEGVEVKKEDGKAKPEEPKKAESKKEDGKKAPVKSVEDEDI